MKNMFLIIGCSMLLISCGGTPGESSVKAEILGDDKVEDTSNSAPVSANVSVSNGNENIEKLVTLSYVDGDSDIASSCDISNLSNITVTTPCSCDVGGICTVGITGTTDYSGPSSFDYTVTTAGTLSNISTSTMEINPFVLVCPTGFVMVLGNGTFGTDDFCIMKYEARNDTGNVGVTSAGTSWQSIAGDDQVADNNNDAYEKCKNMTESGFTGTFRLTSNADWMTIARDIENVPSNWSSGVIGTGHLNRGWSASSGIGDSYDHTAVAPTTDVSCLFSSAANTCSATGLHKFKRTHLLSNSSVIWDFAGNVSEWINWDSTGSQLTSRASDGDDSGWNELNDLVGSITNDDVGPDGAYTATEGMGRWNPNFDGMFLSGGLRGGSWNEGSNAGVFTLDMQNAFPMNTNATQGFRCVYVR